MTGRPWGVERVVREAAQDPEIFGRCERALEEAIEASCVPEQPWPGRVAAAIRAALVFADVDPVAARVLTVHSAFRRLQSAAVYVELVDRLAARLGHAAPPTDRPEPERTARNVVVRIFRQTLLQLELFPETPPTAIAAELIVFALTPYVGLREAQRWADAQPCFSSRENGSGGDSNII